MPIMRNQKSKGLQYKQNVAPSNPEAGDTYYNKDESNIYIRGDSEWKHVLPIPGTGPGSDYGYSMAGKNDTSSISTIFRLTFPHDSGTASHIGNLTGSRSNYQSACNSSDYGFCAGGQVGAAISIVDRILFPFNSGTATHVGNLNDYDGDGGNGFNSSQHGFSIHNSSGSYSSYINRITFPFDSGTANKVGNVSTSGINKICFNSTEYGYSSGGTASGARFSIIDRIQFPFDSGNSLALSNLTNSVDFSAGIDGVDFVSQFANWATNV